MVINWNANLQQCLKQGRIVPTFHASTIEQHAQKIYLTQFLLKQKYSHEEIHDWFKKALNEGYDSAYVNKLILSASRTKHPRQHKYEIFITEKEIQYINNLHYDKEFRSYLLALVCFCKFMKIKRGLAAVSTRDKSYIYYLATGSDDYSIGKQRHSYIEEQYRHCLQEKVITLKARTSTFKASWGGIITKTNITFNGSWIEWDADSGIKITNPEKEIPKLCKKYIKDDMCTCPECGKKFKITKKNKTTLCKQCYDNYRKKQIAENAKKYYHIKKGDAIEQK